MKLTVAALALGMSALSGCSEIPPEAYYNRAAPESLLDVSSEVVNFGLEDETAIDDITQWVNQDQPTRAEIYCMDDNPLCMQVKGVMAQFAVPVVSVAAADNMIALIYERVVARDCENSFIDNSVNPYNFNHPVFGCSIASNLVQHVTDKQQFVSPALLDYADGNKIQQAMDGYAVPYDTVQPKIDTNFKPLSDVSQ